MDKKVLINNPEIIYFSSFCTSIGRVFIAKSLKGVCRISFPHPGKLNFPLLLRNEVFPALTHTIVRGKIQRNDLVLRYETDILKAYFKGEKVTFDFPLDMCKGTLFQKRVWEKLREIPYGECRSYKWVAEQLGNPQAARAVGMANNKNPLPPVIPCHRVIGSDGSLTGYASGVHIKKKLLEMEYGAKSKKCKL